MKKLTSALVIAITASSLLFASCSNNNNSNTLNNNLSNSNSISSNSVRSNWYDSLNPELKAYYKDAQGKTGAALFSSLNKIISSNNKIGSYGDAKGYMYSTTNNTGSGLVAVYSQQFVKGSGSSGGKYRERGDSNGDSYSNDFINCEHVWPQSFFGKRSPMRADIHHLQPTFSRPNNRRGHYPFGNVDGGSVIYTTNSGSRLGAKAKDNRIMSASTVKYVQNLMDEGATDPQKLKQLNDQFKLVFEPTAKAKGNIARSMYYFYLRYANTGGVVRKGDFESDNFWISKLDTFEKWSRTDKVDEEERNRNDRIFDKQKNRNPFVDIIGLETIIGKDVLAGNEQRYSKR